MQHNSWLDHSAYPFAPHFMHLPGGRMHYADEGSGAPIVFVHGTPVWSFVYRAFITDLSRDHRCIAPDHLGFGLSDKPTSADYRPEALAGNLAQLLDTLGLKDMTLVVHDFGGPIGLAYALEHAEHVRRLVIMNTWMWPLDDDPQIARMSRLLSGRLGRYLYTRANISPRQLYPLMFGDKTKFDKNVQQQYVKATSRPEERMAMWTLARELVNSTDWYAQLWSKREHLASIPTLLLWGMKDAAFPPKHLTRWRAALPHAQVVSFPESGHFVQEEMPDKAINAIRSFLET
ncbi:MAG: alpha/beta fold hydrolase [Roseiflexaceae bacterium]|nr:alpha/beta fold hydrolase [Roseiflexaceae bacterium]